MWVVAAAFGLPGASTGLPSPYNPSAGRCTADVWHHDPAYAVLHGLHSRQGSQRIRTAVHAFSKHPLSWLSALPVTPYMSLVATIRERMWQLSGTPALNKYLPLLQHSGSDWDDIPWDVGEELFRLLDDRVRLTQNDLLAAPCKPALFLVEPWRQIRGCLMLMHLRSSPFPPLRHAVQQSRESLERTILDLRQVQAECNSICEMAEEQYWSTVNRSASGVRAGVEVEWDGVTHLAALHLARLLCSMLQAVFDSVLSRAREAEQAVEAWGLYSSAQQGQSGWALLDLAPSALIEAQFSDLRQHFAWNLERFLTAKRSSAARYAGCTYVNSHLDESCDCGALDDLRRVDRLWFGPKIRHRPASPRTSSYAERAWQLYHLHGVSYTLAGSEKARYQRPSHRLAIPGT